MKKINEMNGTEKRAWREVQNAFDWVVGGYENGVSDGNMEEMPSYEDIVEEIYWTVMNCTTKPGCQHSKPCDEVRFAGTEFIKECIKHLMDNGDFEYEVKHDEKDTSAETVEAEEANMKEFWSVVRCKTNIRSQMFVLARVEARSKKHAEDVLFDMNVAPFGNKIFTKQQLLDADKAWLAKVGIDDIEELLKTAQA